MGRLNIDYNYSIRTMNSLYYRDNKNVLEVKCHSATSLLCFTNLSDVGGGNSEQVQWVKIVSAISISVYLGKSL